MKTIVAIHTSRGNVEILNEQFKNYLSFCNLRNIVDDTIIPEVIAKGGVTAGIKRRILSYYIAAESTNPDLILTTCSSVGEVVYMGREIIDSVPLLRIDEPMAEEAVKNYNRIAVLATLPTTLDPTINLVKLQAQKKGKTVEIVNGLANGAYQYLRQGDPQKHDEMIINKAKEITPEADIFLLAQASMARTKGQISRITGKPVYTSPEICLEYLKQLLEKQ